MLIVASCSLSEAVEVNGKLVTVDEEGNKSDRVLLNVEISESDTDVSEMLKKIPKGTVKFFTVNSDIIVDTDLPVFRSYTLEDALENGMKTDYTPLVNVGDDFPNANVNMRTLYELSLSHPGVRFIGGRLLALNGISIGKFDEGKSKMSVNYSDVYDNFLEVKLSEIGNLKEIVKKSRKKLEDAEDKPKKKKASKEHKPGKASKRVAAFSNLFSDVEEVEF